MGVVESVGRQLMIMLLQFGAVVLNLVRLAEDFLRARLTDIGIEDTLQTVVLAIPTLLLLLFIFRIFTPVLRVFLVVFLLVISLQFLDLDLQPRAELRCMACTLG